MRKEIQNRIEKIYCDECKKEIDYSINSKDDPFIIYKNIESPKRRKDFCSKQCLIQKLKNQNGN